MLCILIISCCRQTASVTVMQTKKISFGQHRCIFNGNDMGLAVGHSNYEIRVKSHDMPAMPSGWAHKAINTISDATSETVLEMQWKQLVISLRIFHCICSFFQWQTVGSTRSLPTYRDDDAITGTEKVYASFREAEVMWRCSLQSYQLSLPSGNYTKDILLELECVCVCVCVCVYT